MITLTEGLNIAGDILQFGFERRPIKEIFQLLELSSDLYYNDDEPILTDSEYDLISRYAEKLDPTNPFFLGVGSEVRGGKIQLPAKMGSLDQIYEGQLEQWIEKKGLLPNDICIISHKKDGASSLVVYDSVGKFQIGYSRGNGTMGADTSRHLRQIKSIPAEIDSEIPLIIRGENIISKPNFAKIKNLVKTKAGKPYKNARNAVSSMMNASENNPIVYQYIEFFAYEIVGSPLSKEEQLILLDQLGFMVVPYEKVVVKNLTEELLNNRIVQYKENSNYELDGIVLDINSSELRSNLNPTRSTLNPAYTAKFKLLDETNVVTATVTDVEINPSQHGYLKPRVQFNPVGILGVTVTWATGFNMKFIVENRIGPGAKLKLCRAGDVTPFIMEITKPMEQVEFDDWFSNKINEFGNTKWTDTNVDLVLVDANKNSTVRYEQLVDFFDTIDVPHLAEGNIQKMFDVGCETPESIINLTQEDIGAIINSHTNGVKIFKGMREQLTNIPIYKLMGAHPSFGRGIGVRKMKKLYDAFKGDMSSCTNLEQIIAVEGFDVKTASKIQRGYPIFLKFLEEVGNIVTIAPYEGPKVGSLSGVTVVFTGFRSDELQKAVENIGGKMGSGVSSKTGLVVTDDVNGTSGKLEKARALKIRIITVDELKKILNR
ncbi:MAG: BRCT domain-containing protein [Nitrososphaeraceae archaeon]